ncbi:MAG: hypothetical protein KDA93_20585 [Planctomycetaceae bacterium]|nr:hypothetical protein [Planctomycetaceae bacterium]
MSEFRVKCPQCSKRLVLKDRALLGRKGKCPMCGHRFVLEEPTEATPNSSVDEATSVTSSESQAPPSADVPQIDLRVGADETSTYQRVTGRSRTRGRSWLVIGSLLLLCGLGGAAFVVMLPTNEPSPPDIASEPTSPSQSEATASTPPAEQTPLVEEQSDPVQLLMVPSGARFIVNFRPAKLWSDDAQSVELRGSLTENFVSSVEEFLQRVTHRRPEQIEEVLFAWILGSRGTTPQLATVVHLAQEERLSDLIEEFGAEPFDELAASKVYLLDEQSVLIHDQRTLAFAPREMADELADWINVPNPNTGDGILDLLQQTSRQDLLTVVCEPADLSRHLERLFPQQVQSVARLILGWFADQTEALAWSVQAGNEFRSTLLLRGPSTQSASTLVEQLTGRVESVPAEVLDAVRQMNPQHTGFRKLIGRFPAMLEVTRQSTVTSHDGRVVQLRTMLPPKAGPNLALATLLTWAESLRATSSPPLSSRGTSVSEGPTTIADKLGIPVDAEFNRTPLQEAIDYIAREINVTIEIDGDALKDAGYTKNMPQTFTLGKVSASEALAEIVSRYQEEGKQMVLVVDEQSSKAVLKTSKFAVAAGETPFELTLTEPQ